MNAPPLFGLVSFSSECLTAMFSPSFSLGERDVKGILILALFHQSGDLLLAHELGSVVKANDLSPQDALP